MIIIIKSARIVQGLEQEETATSISTDFGHEHCSLTRIHFICLFVCLFICLRYNFLL
jgi:hypothetical protein